jgi:lysozyme family protein
MSNWDDAFKLMLKSEGGFSDDPRDNGNKLPDGRAGSTMLGVTQYNWEHWIGHEVTHDQMRKLKPEDVKPFYKKKYWDAVCADELPNGISYLVFDFAVNAGVGRTIKTLQTAVGVASDGWFGPATMAAVNALNSYELIDRFSKAKEDFYRGLKDFNVYGEGWMNRVADVKEKATAMVA